MPVSGSKLQRIQTTVPFGVLSKESSQTSHMGRLNYTLRLHMVVSIVPKLLRET